MNVDFEYKKLYDEFNLIKKGLQMNNKTKLEPMQKFAFNKWLRPYEKSAKRTHHNTNSTEFVISNGEDATPVRTFTTTYAVDKEKFCKVYLAAIEANINLSSAGRKVFLVLYNQVRKNIGKDMVQMNYSNCAEVKTEISQPTFARGVRNLYDNEFIAPVEGYASTWWVNPDYIFNGNRLNINSTYNLVDDETGEILERLNNEKAA
jgi:hypothetical protein